MTYIIPTKLQALEAQEEKVGRGMGKTRGSGLSGVTGLKITSIFLFSAAEAALPIGPRLLIRSKAALSARR